MENGKLKDLSVRGLHIIPRVMFKKKKSLTKRIKCVMFLP